MPQQEFDLFEIPAVLRHSLAQVRRRSWAPKCSIPICFDECSTIDQTGPVAQGVAIDLRNQGLFYRPNLSQAFKILKVPQMNNRPPLQYIWE
jgi:hypothetical protein